MKAKGALMYVTFDRYAQSWAYLSAKEEAEKRRQLLYRVIGVIVFVGLAYIAW